MSTFSFSTSISIEYSQAIRDEEFTLKILPKDYDNQKISNLTYLVTPSDYLSSFEDTFLNFSLAGRVKSPHKELKIDVFGVADIYNIPLKLKENEIIPLYRKSTAKTMALSNIKVFHSSLRLKDENNYQRALSYAKAINSKIAYKKGFTNIYTSAEEAFSLGFGVCQDYSQILLSLLRLDNIPCRYVAGIIEGEGDSHSWVEVLCDGYWYTVDALNLESSKARLKFSIGLDSSDTLINKGIYKGFTGSTLKANYLLKRL